MNAFVFASKSTGLGNTGGNREDVYENNGRKKRALELKTLHPDLPIKITQRFGRTHQDLSMVWKKFQQTLIKNG